jgi:hypothetical protein
MYKNDMLRDWTSLHLLDYGWYLDYLKENTPPSKFEIREKHEPGFLQGLGALETKTPSKKRLEGGKGGERDKFRSLNHRCKRRKMSPLNPKKKQSLVWPCHLFEKFQ